MTRHDLFVVALTLAVMGAWYVLWVSPHDQVLASIQNCMGDDTSRAAFDRCWEGR